MPIYNLLRDNKISHKMNYMFDSSVTFYGFILS